MLRCGRHIGELRFQFSGTVSMDDEIGIDHDLVPILQNFPDNWEDWNQRYSGRNFSERERELFTHQAFFTAFWIENTYISLQKWLIIFTLFIFWCSKIFTSKSCKFILFLVSFKAHIKRQKKEKKKGNN